MALPLRQGSRLRSLGASGYSDLYKVNGSAVDRTTKSTSTNRLTSNTNHRSCSTTASEGSEEHTAETGYVWGCRSSTAHGLTDQNQDNQKTPTAGKGNQDNHDSQGSPGSEGGQGSQGNHGSQGCQGYREAKKIQIQSHMRNILQQHTKTQHTPGDQPSTHRTWRSHPSVPISYLSLLLPLPHPELPDPNQQHPTLQPIKHPPARP